jgi:DNA replication protein DnaC
MTLSDLYQRPEVVDFIKEFIPRPFGFLLFSGTNGTGKTYCAMKVYEAISPYKLPAYDRDIAIFTTQVALNLKFGKFSQNGETEYLLENMCTTKLLILDDIGTRTPSEPFMDFLYAIVDTRYTDRAKKGTIITTNLNAEDMRLKFGNAFFSRSASGKCFRFDGEDRRINPLKTSLEDQGRVIPFDSHKCTKNAQT